MDLRRPSTARRRIPATLSLSLPVFALLAVACPAAGWVGRLDAPWTAYTAGDGPAAAVIADLNASGALDLAVANENAGTVSVLLSTVGGAFAQKVDYAVGGDAPVALVAADMNGDGRQDLVTANLLSEDVSILPGVGDGTFGAPVRYAAGPAPVAVAVGDLNGDGRSDLVTAISGANKFTVRLGTAGGSLGAAVDYATGTAPASVALGHWNGGTSLDVAVACAGPASSVSVRLGNGDGTFATASGYALASPNARQIAVGDYSDDGKADLAVACEGSTGADAGVELLRGSGSGTFTGAGVVGVNGRPVALTLRDLDGDGQPDLAAAIREAHRVAVRVKRLAGAPYFESPPAPGDFAYPTGPGPTSVTAGDLNGDGAQELVLATREDDTVSILSRRIGGPVPASYSGGRVVATGVEYATGVAIGNLDGVGSGDVAVSLQPTMGSPFARVYLMGPDGWPVSSVDADAAASPWGLAIGSLNADASPDLLIADSGNPAVSLHLGAGGGSMGPRVDLPSASSGAYSVVAGDVDGDGATDLVSDTAGGSAVSCFLGNGDGTFQSVITSPLSGAASDCVALGDLDGNNVPDLAVAGSGSGTVSILLGAGDGAFTPAGSYTVGPECGWLTLADLDGDGDLDIAAALGGLDAVAVLRNSGTATFAVTIAPCGVRPLGIAAGDVDGDGAVDLVTVNHGVFLAQSGDVTVLPGRGDGTFELPVHLGLEPPGVVSAIPFANSVAIGDVDSDGLPDIAASSAGGTVLESWVTVMINRTSLPTAVEPAAVPRAPLVLAARPNPARGRTVFSFALRAPGRARVDLFDPSGRLVDVLFDGQADGAAQVPWDGRTRSGRTAASGVYLARLSGAGASATRKVVWAR